MKTFVKQIFIQVCKLKVVMFVNIFQRLRTKTNQGEGERDGRGEGGEERISLKSDVNIRDVCKGKRGNETFFRKEFPSGSSNKDFQTIGGREGERG